LRSRATRRKASPAFRHSDDPGKCADNEPEVILRAAAPERIVGAGAPTETSLAEVAVCKYVDGLPFCREGAV
jgi:transposase